MASSGKVCQLSIGPGPSQQPIRDFAEAVHTEESEARALRERGRYYAAWHKASQDFVAVEFLTGVVEAIAKEAAQNTLGGSGSLSKRPTARA